MQLKPRLNMILRSVPNGSAVADIGTDHAFLPIALRQSNIARHVIACDIGTGPLKNAEENVNSAKVDGIELRLSDGLDSVDEKEVDVVVVAGMGGDIIADILRRAEWLKNGKKLVLQPMSSVDAVHDFLYRNGYKITNEHCVFDCARCYVVISAEFDGAVRRPTAAQLLVGEIKTSDGEAERFFTERQKNRCEKCAKSLESVERKAHEYNCMKEAAKQLGEMLSQTKDIGIRRENALKNGD